MERSSQILSELERKLQLLKDQPPSKKVVAGFDGFVDSIRKAVWSRDASGVHHYRTMTEFADRIKKASGKSGQIEMDVQKIKAGGNAPILASALTNFNIPTTCIGSIDHPIFEQLSHKCKTISILPPGESDAIEFDDGKLILSDLSVFQKYDWEYVKSTVGIDRLKAIVNDSQLLALVDWANIEHAGGIWEGLLHEVIKPSGRHDYQFFFDLCDPSKKTPLEIDDVLDLISDFSYYGRVTLGLNENETLAIWSSLTGNNRKVSIEEAGKFIHYTMSIDNLLIHPVDRTYVFTRKEMIELKGRFVTKTKVQTGGGDNLNAGFILGQLAGLSIHESVMLAMASSGYYVQEGISADLSGLQDYVRIWNDELKARNENTDIQPILFQYPAPISTRFKQALIR